MTRRGRCAAVGIVSLLVTLSVSGCAPPPVDLFPWMVPPPLPAGAAVYGRNEPGMIAPQWLVKPTPSFPESAAALGSTQGWAELKCFVTPTGLLAQCSVIGESVPDFGFGHVAIWSARDARFQPATRNGEPVYAPVAFRVNFTLVD